MHLDKSLKDLRTAKLQLSGTEINIGVADSEQPVIWFAVDEVAEVTYVTVSEAKLFIASLETAISQTQDT